MPARNCTAKKPLTPPDDDTRSNPKDEDSSEAVQELRARLEERDREVDELRAEVEQLREQRRQAGHLALAGGRFASWIAARVFIGWDLTGTMRTWFDALHRWLEAKAPPDSIPVAETANLAAAIVRRWLRVGLWHVVLASGGVVTAGILIWQGFLIRGQIKEQKAQNALIRSQLEQQKVLNQEQSDLIRNQIELQKQQNIEQNTLMRTQVDQQLTENLITRRPQLIRAIYDNVCDDPNNLETCEPAEPPRIREDAIVLLIRTERSLIEIEQGESLREDQNSRPVNLSNADLRGLNLRNADLSSVDLRKANLSFADLSGANLVGTNLTQANLTGANLGDGLDAANLIRAKLYGANLRTANLNGTILIRTDLRSADLREADLRGALLQGADFRNSLLKGADFQSADFIAVNLFGSLMMGSGQGIVGEIMLYIRNAFHYDHSEIEGMIPGPDLRGTDISLVRNLTNEQLASACGDKMTALPKGLEPPESWLCEQEAEYE